MKRLRSVQSVPWRLLNLTVKNNYDFELILDVLEVVKVRIFRSLTNLKKTYFSSNYDTDNKKCPWITQISIKNMLYVIKWHTVYRHLQITINSTVLYLPNLIHIFHHRNKKKDKKYVKINISIKHFFLSIFKLKIMFKIFIYQNFLNKICIKYKISIVSINWYFIRTY